MIFLSKMAVWSASGGFFVVFIFFCKMNRRYYGDYCYFCIRL